MKILLKKNNLRQGELKEPVKPGKNRNQEKQKY